MIQKVDVRILYLGRDYNNNLVARVKERRNKRAFWVAWKQDNNSINYNEYISYL